MKPPIRVRRRNTDPTDTTWRGDLRRKWPWSWRCSAPVCAAYGLYSGSAATQPAALAAGLAHLATHTEVSR